MALTALVIAVPAALPGTESRRACAGAGPSWPTETLAVRGGTAWVACKEQFRIVRVDVASGRLRATRLVANAAAAQRGVPTTALRRIDPATGAVTTPVQPRGRVDVHGLVPYRGGVRFADNTGGRLYAVPRF